MKFIKFSQHFLPLVVTFFITVDGDRKTCILGTLWHRGLQRPIVKDRDLLAAEVSFYRSYTGTSDDSNLITPIAKLKPDTWRRACQKVLKCNLKDFPTRKFITVSLDSVRQKVFIEARRCTLFSGIYVSASANKPKKLYVMMAKGRRWHLRVYQIMDISSIIDKIEKVVSKESSSNESSTVSSGTEGVPPPEGEQAAP